MDDARDVAVDTVVRLYLNGSVNLSCANADFRGPLLARS
jgi:hypothetical protein